MVTEITDAGMAQTFCFILPKVLNVMKGLLVWMHFIFVATFLLSGNKKAEAKAYESILYFPHSLRKMCGPVFDPIKRFLYHPKLMKIV